VTDVIRVRDHSEPCEHGSIWAHFEEIRKGRWWKEPDCPGGREMVLESVGDRLWRESDSGGPSSAAED
jgi:hypothetical protein